LRRAETISHVLMALAGKAHMKVRCKSTCASMPKNLLRSDEMIA
jgi:hypothetical protein